MTGERGVQTSSQPREEQPLPDPRKSLTSGNMREEVWNPEEPDQRKQPLPDPPYYVGGLGDPRSRGEETGPMTAEQAFMSIVGLLVEKWERMDQELSE